MTVYIKVKTPDTYYAIAERATIADARTYLSGILKEYKKDSPRGRKRENYWLNRHEIQTLKGSDMFIYRIIKGN